MAKRLKLAGTVIVFGASKRSWLGLGQELHLSRNLYARLRHPGVERGSPADPTAKPPFQELLGFGSAGKVFKAKQKQDNKEVALKVMQCLDEAW